MNRPPKKTKQHKDDLLRDPRFDQKALESARGAKADAAGDDRNLVSIEDAMGSADLSDRLWLLWQRNRNLIVSVIAFVVLVIAGYFASHYLRSQAHASMQEAYVQAQGDSAALATFAGQYASKPLGGVAFISIADEAYAKGEYDKAAELYADSQAGLAQTPLLGRALLGQGLSLARAGKTEDARKQLGSLVENTSVLGALRAQAAFDLIVLEIGAGGQDAAKAWLKRIGEIPGGGVWAEQAAGYAFQHGLSIGD